MNCWFLFSLRSCANIDIDSFVFLTDKNVLLKMIDWEKLGKEAGEKLERDGERLKTF